MRYAWVAVVVALAATGCTSLLGLDKVHSVDRDNDNVPDAIDNCPYDANPDQSDFNHNGKGDACDLCTNGGDQDVDGDGIPDGCDGCIGNGMDVDHDMIDDACDACIGNGMDVDHDHIDDACDPCIGNGMDVDHDGIDDFCDTCIQTFIDADGDGIDDGCDPCVTPPGHDTDGDGLEDACDPCPLGPQHDEDGDMIYDACDTCQAVASSVQVDSDGDTAGDPCDPWAGSPEYERIDTFTTQNPEWFIDGSGWTLGNDVAHVSTIQPSYRWLTVVTTRGVVRTRFKVPPTLPISGNADVELIAFDQTSATANTQLRCALDSSGNVTAILRQGNVTSSSPGNKQVNTGGAVDLMMTLDDKNKLMTCQAKPADDPSTTGAVATISYNVSLDWYTGIEASHILASFEYFDVIAP